MIARQNTGQGRKIAQLVLEFVGLCLLVAAVPFVVFLDTSVFGDAMSEQSLTELLHNLLLLVSAMVFASGAVTIHAARGYLVLMATVFTCMFIRESDGFLDAVWHGFWAYPAWLTLCIGVYLATRDRATIAKPMLVHFQGRPATFIYVGMLLLLIFTRTFGMGALWEGVMKEHYDPIVKAAIQEGLELLAYVLIAYGSVTSCWTRFGQSDGARAVG